MKFAVGMKGGPRVAEWFLWFKLGHIVSMVAWMAALFYLPRLFVYHTKIARADQSYEMFCVMERRLANAIMTPAAVSTWIFGLLAGWSVGYFDEMPAWLWVKIVLVVVLSAFHMMLVRYRIAFRDLRNDKSERYFRIVNEVPTLLLLGIVGLVVLRPF